MSAPDPNEPQRDGLSDDMARLRQDGADQLDQARTPATQPAQSEPPAENEPLAQPVNDADQRAARKPSRRPTTGR